jgi:dihydrolipoamide dehydrogenase
MTRVVIIGAYGSAGAAVASALANEPDVELTLVDDGDPGGGLCILRGCMPSKGVFSAAAHRYQARSDDRLGGAPAVDFAATVGRKDDHVANFARHRQSAFETLADRENVDFYHETASFADRDVGDHRWSAPGRSGAAVSRSARQGLTALTAYREP